MIIRVAYLVYGGATPWSGAFLSSDADASWRGEELDDYLGSGLSGGDIDGDGRSEILVGAFGSDLGASYGGATYVLPGESWAGTMKVEDEATAVLSGSDYGAYTGFNSAVGDADGDGYGDILLGGYSAKNPSGYTTGAAWLFLGTGM